MMKLKIYCRIIIAAILLNTFPGNFIYTAHSFSGGSGTLSDPYLISTCEELQSIAYGAQEVYSLSDDIDCSATSSWNAGAGFDPIEGFNGTLIGNNYTIENLFIDRNDLYTGLFAQLHGAALNFNITGSVSGGAYTGAVAGRIEAGSLIMYVDSTADITGTAYVGGIAGASNYGDIYKSSYQVGEITGGVAAGGIIGNVIYGGYVQNNFADAVLNADYTGGIIGLLDQASQPVINNWSGGTSTTGTAGGGIIGRLLKGGGSLDVTNNFSSLATGEGTYQGGIIGIAEMTGGTINLVGDYFDTINTGAEACVGHQSGGTINDDCVTWNVGVTPDYLKNNSTDAPLTAWDFESTWETTPNFPQLQTYEGEFSVPSAVQNLTVDETVDPNVFEVSWDEPADLGGFPINYYVYQLYLADDDVYYENENATDELTVEIEPRAKGQEYVVKVYAVNIFGDSEIAESEFTSASYGEIEIDSCETLQTIDDEEEYTDMLFTLTSNIDCTDIEFTPLAGNWIDETFAGTLDGQGYTISNLTIEAEGAVGLLSYCNNGTIKDLNIEGGSITGVEDVGAIVGNSAGCRISNVNSSATVTAEYSGGGLVGVGEESAIISSSSTGEVTANADSAGGLMGYSNYENIFYNSYSTADVYGYDNVGGFIGNSSDSDHIYYSYASGDVYSTGGISAGGFIGYEAGVYIENAYARGDVISAGEEVGGFLGTAEGGEIYNTYSTGFVEAVDYLGGYMGYESDSGDIISSFWDVESSELDETGDSYTVGKTTEEMKSIETFTSELDDDEAWDFDDIWVIDDNGSINDGYPYFQWQGSPSSGGSRQPGNTPQGVTTTTRYFNGHGGGGDNTDNSATTEEDTSTDDGSMTYDQEVKRVMDEDVVKETPDAAANKCEVLMMMSRVFEWQVPEATTSNYTDLPDWCISLAAFGTTRGIVEGRTPTALGLETPVTRFEVAVMVYRELKLQNYEFTGTDTKTFSDEIVPWAQEAVAALAKEGILKGFPNGTFAGPQGILKQDLGVILLRVKDNL